ncbi:hypothetical protein M758_11G093000 [Ceratodon purpureus]|nr:hypothetical protein M758_11G093000 [Ceratodon purpureus]
MADVAEAEPAPGLPAAAEAPAALSRAASHLSSSDHQAPAGGSPKVNQRSFSFPHGSSPKAEEEGAVKSTVSGFSQWARGLRLPSSLGTSSGASAGGESTKVSPFTMLTSGFAKRVPAKAPAGDVAVQSTSAGGTAGAESVEGSTAIAGAAQEGNAFDTFTKGFMDSSRNAVRTVQLKARHLVSQNKRRYQEGGFDLDMAYITENIIAMGFPAGDKSSGLLGYVEGFYRNHMEEVLKFFETNHKGKYKVYNLCSERLYDASLFGGKVACFPFDDHNCPPLQLVAAFCQSAYSWLKGDLENVVVVHCKAGMARTGLMITCLLMYLKFFPTAEESINYYNQKRCVDGKGLILPSQIRYVKYFERVLKEFHGETPQGRKCILRGIRLHKCPYWVRPGITISDHNGVLFSSKKHPRTKDLLSEDIWFNAPRKGVLVFALPGERCVADINGDFKIQFSDRHGDFYCWLNTNMMETRQILETSDLDGFEKRRLPSPGLQVEVVILDHDAPIPRKKVAEGTASQSAAGAKEASAGSVPQEKAGTEEGSRPGEAADVGGDANGSVADLSQGSTTPGSDPSVERKAEVAVPVEASAGDQQHGDPSTDGAKVEGSQGEDKAAGAAAPQSGVKDASVVARHDESPRSGAMAPSDFKAIAAASAADASVFTFGDDDDYDSEEELH